MSNLKTKNYIKSKLSFGAKLNPQYEEQLRKLLSLMDEYDSNDVNKKNISKITNSQNIFKKYTKKLEEEQSEYKYTRKNHSSSLNTQNKFKIDPSDKFVKEKNDKKEDKIEINNKKEIEKNKKINEKDEVIAKIKENKDSLKPSNLNIITKTQISSEIILNQNVGLSSTKPNSNSQLWKNYNSIKFFGNLTDPLKLERWPKITAKSWAIFESNSIKFINGKLPHHKREIASLTKIMTCLLTLNLLEKYEINPNKVHFTVTRAASTIGGTSSELQEGDVISIWDLLHGTMLPSGNDAAYTLGEYMGIFIYLETVGKLTKAKNLCEIDLSRDFLNIKDPMKHFIFEMNELAQDLYLSQTNFNNTHGMSIKINNSTAYDVACLTCHALKNKTFTEIVRTKTHYTVIRESFGSYKDIYWENTNKLLDYGYYGVKTGITPNAGPCLSAYYKFWNEYLKEDMGLVVVVLNCENVEDRFYESKRIAEWCKKEIYELFKTQSS